MSTTTVYKTQGYSEPVKTYEVIRGIKFDNERFRQSLYPLVFTDNERDILAFARQIERDGQNNYGGCFFSNKFRVNARINLHGLGFFGPVVEEEAIYHISVDMLESIKDGRMTQVRSRKVATFRNRKVTAKRGEIYFVDFYTPVNINPGLWYDIQFCLEGPDTTRCEKVYRQAQVNTSIGTLHFDFTEGSKQMPELRFSLL